MKEGEMSDLVRHCKTKYKSKTLSAPSEDHLLKKGGGKNALKVLFSSPDRLRTQVRETCFCGAECEVSERQTGAAALPVICLCAHPPLNDYSIHNCTIRRQT